MPAAVSDGKLKPLLREPVSGGKLKPPLREPVSDGKLKPLLKDGCLWATEVAS
jgi:hypothetical protein